MAWLPSSLRLKAFRSIVNVNSCSAAAAISSSVAPSVRLTSFETATLPVPSVLDAPTGVVCVRLPFVSVTAALFSSCPGVPDASTAAPSASTKALSSTRTLNVRVPDSWAPLSPRFHVITPSASGVITLPCASVPALPSTNATPAGSVSVTVTFALLAAPVASTASLVHLMV